MEIVCTYCSANKDMIDGLIPAYKRYISSRIVRVQEIAINLGIPFCILSGQFGLLDSSTPLPWYDHLLLPNEVADRSITVQRQLTEMNISKVNYFTRSLELDPNLSTYLDLIQSACKSANIELSIHILEQSSANPSLID